MVVKAIHLIGVITWFAGLFYIFRLYVYHTENQHKDDVTQVLQVMERKLYYYITWPALVLTTLAGGVLLWQNPGLLKSGWMHTKLFFLLFLFGYHFYSGHIRKAFAQKNFKLTSKQCRLINEVPTLVLLVVVPLAILKPF